MKPLRSRIRSDLRIPTAGHVPTLEYDRFPVRLSIASFPRHRRVHRHGRSNHDPGKAFIRVTGVGSTFVASAMSRTARASGCSLPLCSPAASSRSSSLLYPSAGIAAVRNLLSFGQRARLVECDAIGCDKAISRSLGVLDEHPTALAAPPGAGHDSGRRGKTKRAGTGDHQDRDGVEDRSFRRQRLRQASRVA